MTAHSTTLRQPDPPRAVRNHQQNTNGEVHDWYRLVLGYSDHLVGSLLRQFALEPGHLLLDPFCGAGTTLVEAMKAGIQSVGIDANPSSCFAAAVKTDWTLDPDVLELCIEDLVDAYAKALCGAPLAEDPTYAYLASGGFIDRGWISAEPLRKAIAMKRAIASLPIARKYRHAMTLCLMAELVAETANVRFGPELYCGPRKIDTDVLSGVTRRLNTICDDLWEVQSKDWEMAEVFRGDARALHQVRGLDGRRFDAVICSPPYPAEHDYTRNARLELALLEAVTDLRSLRAVKQQMIRCNTKGIYSGDDDASFCPVLPRVQAIADELRSKIVGKTHGFARFYPKVVEEYFGGMARHLQSLKGYLKPGARCAYVVGDQSPYLGVQIPTAEILRELAGVLGFSHATIDHWRSRRVTKTNRLIDEHIVMFAYESD